MSSPFLPALVACACFCGCAQGSATVAQPGGSQVAGPTTAVASQLADNGPVLAVSSPPPSASALPSASANAAPASSVSASAPGPAPGAAIEEPPLVGPDGATLPQTDERPTLDSPVYQRNVRLLFEAIVKDDPEIARPFFFPVIAYEQVKAIEKPARDWQHRLWRNFVRDVHAYHAQLGDRADGATLDRVEVRVPAVQWMKPHTEGNRIGYFRVTRSRILGRKADGRPLDLELTSMISWRGRWYVVHLHGYR